ncbi:MAG: Gfo/Idh/MocA family oxidoreductase [Planctomycetales bacterium]
MLKVGIAGVGFMGMIHYLAYRDVGDAQVTALCTRNEKKLSGDWREIKGNFGPPGEMMDLSGINKHRRLETLLADESVDLVDICLPPDMHADAAVRALQAGKHVLVEKPMTLRTKDADRMMDAAAKSGKQLLVAHVLPFFPEFRTAREIVVGGKFGKMLGGFFKRIISDPTWLSDFYDPNKVGGPVVDLHIHDAHFIRMLCGLPEAVFARGRMRGEVVEFMTSQFLYADQSLNICATSGVINQQGRPFTHGFEIHLEKATLIYESAALVEVDSGTGIPFTVLTPDGRAERPSLGSGDPVEAFVSQLSEAADAVRQGRPSPLLGGDLARDALLICGKETQSVIEGQAVSL